MLSCAKIQENINILSNAGFGFMFYYKIICLGWHHVPVYLA